MLEHIGGRTEASSRTGWLLCDLCKTKCKNDTDATMLASNGISFNPTFSRTYVTHGPFMLRVPRCSSSVTNGCSALLLEKKSGNPSKVGFRFINNFLKCPILNEIHPSVRSFACLYVRSSVHLVNTSITEISHLFTIYSSYTRTDI